MGTNYYLFVDRGRTEQFEDHAKATDWEGYPAEVRKVAVPLHIGKSSCGWCFSLHVIPELGLNDWRDWEALASVWRDRIYNEYGERKTLEDLRSTIFERSGKPTPAFVTVYDPSRLDSRTGEYATRPITRAEYELSHMGGAHQDPKYHLYRHPVGRYCVGHGDGPYDLVPGEFS